MTLPTPYYQHNNITIYHADCHTILPHINPDTIDLLLTDPPYGMNLNPDWRGWNGGGQQREPVRGDDTPFDPAPSLRYERVLLFGANWYSSQLPEGQWVVWVKPDMAAFMADGELAWHNLGGKSVSVFEKPWASRRWNEPRVHPTQKPVALMRWILDKWTQPGDTILDPYMGSGPIAQAANDLGRRYIGIEIEEAYCQIATNRLAQQTLTL